MTDREQNPEHTGEQSQKHSPEQTGEKSQNRSPEQSEDITRISVRALVEFILRSGDIDNRSGGLRDTEAMQLGSQLHRRIQAGAGKDYRSEVPLSMDFSCSMTGEDDPVSGEDVAAGEAAKRDAFIIRLEGRADGLVTETPDSSALIDEIKGVLRPVELIEEPVPVHLAQAKCYAYMYAVAHALKEIRVRVTYASLVRPERSARKGVRGKSRWNVEADPGEGAGSAPAETETDKTIEPDMDRPIISGDERLRYFNYTYTFEELAAWFESVLAAYEKWARFERRWMRNRTAAIKETTFPYPFREGQQELMRDVYRTILREKQLFIQAPTGVGKTLSCVFPSVKAMGEGKADRIFYLTAKTITRTAAQTALALLRAKGLRIKSITLTAKEKTCPLQKPACDPDSCPYAKGHFDRINDAVFALINARDAFGREDILEAAETYQVCPHELSLDIASWMDVVIGDYNYAFHPRSKLKRFFGEGVKGTYIFLVDEAHNLVDRGRDMYSAALVREDLLALRRMVKGAFPELVRPLKKLAETMLVYKRALDESEKPYLIPEKLEGIPEKALNLYGALESFFKDVRDGNLHVEEEIRDAALELYFTLGRFLDVLSLVDENYVIYTENLPGRRFMLRLFCVNPAANLKACFEKGRASILFSATLLPIDYYKQMLGTPESYAVYARSCFDRANLTVITGVDVSTRYTRRNAAAYAGISEYILRMVSARAGNYMVFFSSYRMLEDTETYFRLICPSNVRVACQTQGMDEAEREAFLALFQENRSDTLVGLCVMGSLFGEGIDLKGESLIGVAVVGPGLPMVCAEQEILRGWFEGRAQDGFRLAYQCPGMNKVMQAAGRVIRTETDRGIVLLLDERFAQHSYRQMFPREWGDTTRCRLETVTPQLEAFWD